MVQLETALAALARFYGLLSTPPRDPFILFVWEVLSPHTTPAKRDAALAALKRIRALTPDAMWQTPQKKLEQAVVLTGPFLERRVSALKAGVALFRRSPALSAVLRGPMPAARRSLKRFPQLGEGGAHRMLLFAADHAVLPVDARVNRVGRRLGYGTASGDFRKSARSVQQAISRELPRNADSFRRAFLYLSHHGAVTCTEADPHCQVCPLLRDCPEGQIRAR